MRKCTARAWVNQKGRKGETGWKPGYWTDIQGVFHGFGQTFEEFADGAMQVTYAIVEDTEGQLWEAELKSVKFIEVKK